MVAAVEKAGVAQHGLVQLPPRPGGDASSSRWSTTGKLGKIFHYRAKFLQDWTINPDVPQGGAGTWRLDVEAAGSGVTGDLLAHCIDTAIWINGAITDAHRDDRDLRQEAQARRHRQDAEGRHRRRRGGARALRQRLARHCSNRPATPAATRRSTRSRSTASSGSFIWDLHDLNRVQWFDHSIEGRLRGWTVDPRHRRRPPLSRQMVGAGPDHRLRAHLRPPGRRLPRRALKTGKPASPTFREALETTKVCDAIIKSGKTEKWVQV